MVNPSLGIPTQENPVLPGFFGRYKEGLSNALRQTLSQGDNSGLYDTLRYHMGWVDAEGCPTIATTGKALRPVLCLFACQCTGRNWEQALPAAVSLELIHNFSLIHDDVQDGDRERHGRPTLWAVWGQPKAIVAGNVMRVLADKAMWGLLQEGVSYSQALTVSRLLVQSYLDMIEGQYLDLSYEKCLDISVKDYWRVISLKTGALIRCALETGAIIGRDDPVTTLAFRRCGEFLGQAFQVRDDYLGVWGDEHVTGKAVGADIRRKKKSFPVVYTLEQAHGRGRELLRMIYSKGKLDDEDVATVLSLMDKGGAKEHTEGLVEEKCRQALQTLEATELSPQSWWDIKELSEFLLTRKH